MRSVSMKELLAHLRGEIRLSETMYHMSPGLTSVPYASRLGLSQADAAALFGFNVGSVQDREQGHRRPDMSDSRVLSRSRSRARCRHSRAARRAIPPTQYHSATN